MLLKPFGFAGSSGGTGIGYGDPPYKTGLITYYDFGDATDGSYTAGDGTLANGAGVADLSGFGYNSTLDNNSNTQNFFYDSTIGRGVVRTANKNGGHFVLSDYSGDQLGLSGFSFEFVFQADSMGDDNVLIRFSGGSANSRIETNLQQYSSSPPKRISFDFTTEQGTGIGVGLTNQAINNGWHHLVYTAQEGDVSKLYFDGSAIGSGSTAWPSGEEADFDETNAWFGTTNYAAGCFNGDIGVFRIYDNGMSAPNVASNYSYYSSIYSGF